MVFTHYSDFLHFYTAGGSDVKVNSTEDWACSVRERCDASSLSRAASKWTRTAEERHMCHDRWRKNSHPKVRRYLLNTLDLVSFHHAINYLDPISVVWELDRVYLFTGYTYMIWVCLTLDGLKIAKNTDAAATTTTTTTTTARLPNYILTYLSTCLNYPYSHQLFCIANRV